LNEKTEDVTKVYVSKQFNSELMKSKGFWKNGI